MVHLRPFLAVPLLLAVASGPVAAQHTPVLDATYSLAYLQAQDGTGVCAPTPNVRSYVGFGEITFQPDGTFLFNLDVAERCSDSGSPIITTDSGSGIYTLDPNGEIVLDVNPSAPGTDVVDLDLTWDEAAFVGRFRRDGEPRLLVGVRHSTGALNSLLAGSYEHVAFEQEQGPAGLRVEAKTGSLDFSGTGSWSAFQLYRSLGPSGITNGSRSLNGTVAVLPDGRLLVDGSASPRGAVTGDGRFGFWVEDLGGDSELRLFVRRPSAPVTLGALEEDWWVATYGGGVDSTGTGVGESTGSVNFDPVAGSWAFSGYDASVSVGSTSGGPSTTGGSFTLGADGLATLSELGSPVILGRLSAKEDVMLFADLGPPDRATIGILVRAWGPLDGDVDTVSVSAGGNQTLRVRAGREAAGRTYWVLGSRTGSEPGLVLGGGIALPLNYDAYLLQTVTSPNAGPLVGTLGILDANGRATASISLPPGVYASAAGTRLVHASILLGPSGLEGATNAVPLLLAP